jgi:hypothetical protein
MTRRRLPALLVVAAGLAGLWWATRPEPPSDEAQIRALFAGAAAAAEAGKVSEAVAGLSERFQGHGLDRAGAKRLVAGLVLRRQWVAVKVAGARVAVDGDSATAQVDAVLASGGAGKALADLLPAEASAHRFDCRLAREAEGWRVVSAGWRAIPLEEALGAGDGAAAPTR